MGKGKPSVFVSLAVIAVFAVIAIIMFSGDNEETNTPSTSAPLPATSRPAPRPESSESDKPQTSDFAILDSYWKPVPGIPTSIWVMGEVKNNGSIAAGVELEATAYDKDGRVLDSSSFWPASIRNIAAGDTCPIKFGLTANSSNVSRVRLRVVSARVWN